MTVDLQTIVSNAVESSMKGLRATFANDVTEEIKSHVNRYLLSYLYFY